MEWITIALSFIKRWGKKLTLTQYLLVLLLTASIYAYNDISSKIVHYSISQNFLMEAAIENLGEISAKCEFIRGRVDDADYVSITLFKNGEVSVNRMHLLKMQRIAEGVKFGLPSKKELNTDYPLSPYVPLANYLIANDIIYIPDASKCKNLTLKKTLDDQNLKSIIYLPIYYTKPNGFRDIGGFMCIEYKRTTNFDDKKIDFIKNEKQHVEVFLQNSVDSHIAKFEL